MGTVTCSKGYTPTANGATSVCTLEPTAKLTATWVGTLACEAVQCPQLSEITQQKTFQHSGSTNCANAGTLPYLTECSLECNDNYKIEADKATDGVVTCDAHATDKTIGAWSVQGGATLASLTCTEIFCPAFSQSKPDKSDNVKDDTTGVVDCYDSKTRSIGTTCTVTCSKGYTPTANGATSACTLVPTAKITATWVGTLACEAVQCPQLSEITQQKTFQHSGSTNCANAGTLP